MILDCGFPGDFTSKFRSVSQFKGSTVLELASVLAGPAVGQFFAELGADVIKVENLRAGGDVTRSWRLSGETTDDRSAYFCSVNWGKRSIAVDLSRPQGREVVHRLATRADIVLASYKLGDAEKHGVDYATLSRQNPALIYGRITGYGSENPKVGYDAVIQAESGFMSMNGEPEGKPLKLPVALIDILAAHHLKEGLLLALLEKQVTGKGKLVEVSLIQAALSSLANQGTNWLVGGVVPSRQGSAHPNIAPYGDIFLTSDHREILLAVGTDGQFQALCDVLGLPAVATEERFRTNLARVNHRNELRSLLEEKIKAWSSEELIRHLDARKIPAAIIRNVREALESDAARDLLLTEGPLKSVRTFVAGTPLSHFLPPPRLGEHTREVMTKDLLFAPEEVDLLYKSRIIA